MDQISMFDLMYPTFKTDNPVRLIELFAGVGSQASVNSVRFCALMANSPFLIVFITFVSYSFRLYHNH